MYYRWLKRRFSRRRQAIRAADAARDCGEAMQAAERYGAILRRWGSRYGLLIQYGNALKDSGQFALADAAYLEAQDLQPGEAEVFLQRGHLAKMTGRADDAQDLYFLAWDLDPDLPGLTQELPRRKLGRRLRSDGRSGEDVGLATQLAGWLADADLLDQPEANAATYRQAVAQLVAARCA